MAFSPLSGRALRPHHVDAISIVRLSLGAGIPNAALVIMDEADIRDDMVDTLINDRHDVFFIELHCDALGEGHGAALARLGDPLSRSWPKPASSRSSDGQREARRLRGVQTWLEKGENRPTFRFGVNWAHAAILQGEFEANGVASPTSTPRPGGHLLGTDHDRTGVDLPVRCIVDAAPTKSEIVHVRKIGLTCA